MDRRQYLALVLREATSFVNEHERALREALSKSGDPVDLDGVLERRLKAPLVEADSLEDVLKHSELREIPPEHWRGASRWPEALASAAMAALAHDVGARARDILEGKVPRLDNIQIS